MTTSRICQFKHSTARIVEVLVRSSRLTQSEIELEPSINSRICRETLSLNGWLFRKNYKLARAKQVCTHVRAPCFGHWCVRRKHVHVRICHWSFVTKLGKQWSVRISIEFVDYHASVHDVSFTNCRATLIGDSWKTQRSLAALIIFFVFCSMDHSPNRLGLGLFTVELFVQCSVFIWRRILACCGLYTSSVPRKCLVWPYLLCVPQE